MNFFVTLPSNFSSIDYPFNTQSDYTTVLANPLELNGKYELALAEIDYSTSIKCVMGKLEVHNYFKSYFNMKSFLFDDEKLLIDIVLQNRISSSEFAREVNKLLREKCLKLIPKYLTDLYLETPSYMIDLFKGKYKNIDDISYIDVFYKTIRDPRFSFTSDIFITQVYILDEENSLLKKFYNDIGGYYCSKLKKWIFKNNTKFQHKTIIFNEINLEKIETTKNFLEINFDEINNNFVFDNSTNSYFVWSGSISHHLFNNDNFSHNSNYKIQLNDKYLDFIKYMCLYCDIIEDQYFGNKLTPILKLITFDESNNKLVKNFENLHYVPVRKNRISTINIALKDLSGNPILFLNNFGFVVVKLHFRKV